MKTFKNLFKFLSFFLLAAIFACSGDGGSSLPSGDGSGGTGTGTSDAATVTLTASPTSVGILGTASVTATVLDSTGATVSDGTAVDFSITFNPNLGSVTSQATTANGIATTTFTAASSGVVTITGTSGSVSGTVDITISSATAGSIKFDSATPNAIAVRGYGGVVTSLIKFSVKDENGNSIVDGVSVDFSMSGPSGGRLPDDGGEYIGDPDDGTPTTASASTVNGGEVSLYLNSGLVAGPVTIVATVTGTTPPLSSSAAPISIGGGVPNDVHLTVTTDTWNLTGLGSVEEATIKFYMADRFGHANVLQGTSVTFYPESGAMKDGSNVTDANGITSGIFETINPNPADVQPLGWETALQARVLTEYGINTSSHPRDGWTTIMVSTRGEETFTDRDGNGMYDFGEFFTDTPHEPFLDANNNGLHDDETSLDPEELYIDDDFSGNYTIANTIWDDEKTIFEDITLLITGLPAYIEVSVYDSTASTWGPTPPFTIGNGESRNFKVIVSDINLNPLKGGAIVAISNEGGDFSGTSSYTFPNLFLQGPVELYFTLADSDSTDTDPPEPAIITIKVDYFGLEYIELISGTID